MIPGDCLEDRMIVEVPIGMKVKKILWRPGGITRAQ
jgi:hypothetical protein